MLSLPEIYDGYRMDPAFDHFRKPGVVLVPGEGSSKPRALIVGEAPGATENTHRRPFVGASGCVLRSLITDAAGLRPEEYFITNTVKYWPGPGNRTPDPDEIKASVPYLRQEYAALGSPPVLVAVGAAAFHALRPGHGGILAVAGRLCKVSSGVYLWPMVHPSYGLRKREFRPKMEQHWSEFGEWFRAEYR